MSGKRPGEAAGGRAKKPRRSRRLAPEVATVIVRNLLGAVQAELEVALNSSVRELRRVVAQNARLSVDEVKLMYRDRELRADDQRDAQFTSLNVAADNSRHTVTVTQRDVAKAQMVSGFDELSWIASAFKE